MDDQIQPQDAPVEPVQDTTTPAPAVDDANQDATETEVSTPAVAEALVETVEEDYGYPEYKLPPLQPLDIASLPVNEQNLIDPDAMSAAFNQQIANAEERATMRARQSFQEQQAETRAWDKAYEKYPDLKGNKELRDMVQQARIGQFTESFNRNTDPSTVKIRTPMQVADTIFKHIGTAKQEGMKQATTNTVVQQSAYTETSGRRSSDTGDARNKAFQNINNPNKAVANQARNDLLRKIAFGDE